MLNGKPYYGADSYALYREPSGRCRLVFLEKSYYSRIRGLFFGDGLRKIRYFDLCFVDIVEDGDGRKVPHHIGRMTCVHEKDIRPLEDLVD